MKAFCQNCDSHQPFRTAYFEADEKNPEPWGEHVCNKCHSILMTFLQPINQQPELIATLRDCISVMQDTLDAANCELIDTDRLFIAITSAESTLAKAEIAL